MAATESSPQKWALLIGVDFYIKGAARTDTGSGEVTHYRHLHGCVNDVVLVESFLKDELSLDASHITKLTSTNLPQGGQREPPEDPSSWPTRENISKAFGDLRKKAPGDLVYIHYSGHGARVRTAYRFRGLRGVDEALVPADIETGQGRYIRDLEMARWLKGLVDARLQVTLVLDSCHSGSSNRATSYEGTRGTGAVDWSLLPSDMVEAPQMPEQLDGLRHGELRNNWLLEASGYLMIAACSGSQTTLEEEFPRKHLRTESGEARATYGVLTYYLIDSLQSLPPSKRQLTALLSDVVAKVHSHDGRQTPLMEGMVDNPFFGFQGYGTLGTDDIRVTAVYERNKTVRLNHGHLHGVRKGAEYDIYSDGAPAVVGNSLARVTVRQVRDLECDATITTATGESRAPSATESGAEGVGMARVGFRALLCKLAPDVLLGVRLVAQGASNGGGMEETWMESFRQHIEQQSVPPLFWRLLPDFKDEVKPSFFVSVTEQGYYEIKDDAERPLADIPPLLAGHPDWENKLRTYMDHLAKFRFAQLLVLEPVSSTAFEGKCSFCVLGRTSETPTVLDIPTDQKADDDHKIAPYDPVRMDKTEKIGRMHVVNNGDVINIVFRNEWTSPVYLTVFNLAQSWSIKKLYPGESGVSEEVGNGEERRFSIRMTIPESPSWGERRREITDTFRAIVTKTKTSLDSYRLPEITALFGSETETRRATLVEFPLLRSSWQVFDIMVCTRDTANDRT